MIISEKSWSAYLERLRRVNDKAASLISQYIQQHDITTKDGHTALLEYVEAVVEKYSEGAAEAACEMYDAIAEASGKVVPPAEPAPAPTFGDVAKTINGTMKHVTDPDGIGASCARLVKRTGVDTTMQNAIRDGAEWAWIPHGDTCGFCLMLASNGWQKASKKALKGGHAEHIHANCDCTYAIRFDGKSNVAGYDQDALYEQYMNAGSNRDKRLRNMQSEYREHNKERRNEQRSETYARQRQISFDPASKLTIKRGGNITLHKTTDGKHGLYISDNANVKKQALTNIERTIDDSIEKLGISQDAQLPQIIVLNDKEMMTKAFAAYDPVSNRLYLRDSLGDKRKTRDYQRKYGFSAPNDPNSTTRHEMIHWQDAEEYKKEKGTITRDNYRSEYLSYRQDQCKIKLQEAGLDESNLYKVSKYANDSYFENDYDEAYTEYRTLVKG